MNKLSTACVLDIISINRTFVFELGAVLLLLLFTVDGIWYSVVFAELMAAATVTVFMVAL